jgi:hypothetical protein
VDDQVAGDGGVVGVSVGAGVARSVTVTGRGLVPVVSVQATSPSTKRTERDCRQNEYGYLSPCPAGLFALERSGWRLHGILWS